MDMKFFKCSHCGNIVAYVQSNGPKVSCCGEEMKELVANGTAHNIKNAKKMVEKLQPEV